MHGGHVLSGKQTDEGRQRIADATRARMLAAWDAYREAERQDLPLPRLGRPKRPPRIVEAPRPQPKPTVLTEQDIEFARLTGMLPPEAA